MLGNVKESISLAMTELRDIAKSLNSQRIQLLSLQESISQEIRRINRSGFIKVSSDIQGIEKNIPDQHKLIAFRIVQEGLAKHYQTRGGLRCDRVDPVPGRLYVHQHF